VLGKANLKGFVMFMAIVVIMGALLYYTNNIWAVYIGIGIVVIFGCMFLGLHTKLKHACT
jgi:cytochrome c biogenesis protein CcdA